MSVRPTYDSPEWLHKFGLQLDRYLGGQTHGLLQAE